MGLGGETLDIEVRMSRLAGRDASRIMASNPVIIIPMGSHEDQGPHAPMGDFLLAERIGELGARRAHASGVPAFVAPVLPYGGEDFFMSAMGGLAVQQSTMTSILVDLMNALIDNGLNRIILLNGHGGNVNPIFLATRRIHVQRRIVVPSLYLWEAAYAALPAIVGEDNAKRRASHGADPLGSVTQFLFPELFKSQYVPEQTAMKRHPTLNLEFLTLGKVSLGGLPVSVPNDYADAFHDGVGGGDPTQCDENTGRLLTETLVDAIAKLAAIVHSKPDV
jgi:creatinine amidohydrolase